MSDVVDNATEEATTFVMTVSSMYNENKGYASGLSRLEKSLTEIKPFSAGSEVTVFKFLNKFNAYCTATRKAKAYKLDNNYLSTLIQAQTASFQQDFDALVAYLKSNYGKIEVISAGLLAKLERQKKPGDRDLPEQAESLLAIMNVILQLQNLKMKLPAEQVMAEITSYIYTKIFTRCLEY